MKKFPIFNFQFSILFLIIFSFGLLFLFFLDVLAQTRTNCPTGLVPCGGTDCPCQFCDLFVLFKKIVDFLLFTIVPPLAILMLVIAGAMYMLAHMEVVGSPNWIIQAKSLIWSVVIGLIIIYGAWLIVSLFFQIIGIAEWTDLKAWWQIKCP